MSALISFAEFTSLIDQGSGILLFVLTSDCDDAADRLADDLRGRLGRAAAVYLMCADAEESPVLVFYEGGDHRPLVRRSGAASVHAIAEHLAEAIRVASIRPSAADEAAQQAEVAARTERMLAAERLDDFPPFFRMARSLARDAWRAARQTAAGAPLLLPGEAAAARLQICQSCPSLRGDRCQECGCYMTVKANLATTSCPLAKWPNTSSS